MLARLTGCREGRERAAVKAAEGADHSVASTPAVLASQLDGALDRLGAAVGEEDSSPLSGGFGQQFVDGDRRGGRLRVGKVVADVEQFGRLRRDRRGNRRIGMAE